MKVALRMADAFLTDPAGFSDEVKRQAAEQFTPEQIVELTMKYVFATVNKPTIALGFDSAIDEENLSAFVYDEEGYFVVEGLGAVNANTG